MSVSGSIDFAVTRDDIITEALLLCGVIPDGDSPSDDQITSVSRTLNMMIKNWQAEGLNLFAVQEVFLFLEKGKSRYTMGEGNERYGTDIVDKTLDGAHSAGTVNLTVSSTSGMVAGNDIGIQYGSSDMEWHEIGLVVDSTTVSLVTALENDAADGAAVYSYDPLSERPMAVHNVIRRDAGGSDTPLTQLSRSDYMNLAAKTSSGAVTGCWFDPQLLESYLWVYPRTDKATDYLVMYVQRTLNDFDLATDNPDFPQEWYMPLAYGLAVAIAPKYGVPVPTYQMLVQQAQYYKEVAHGFDREYSVIFGVNTDG
jgi:hypothetical protein